MSNRYWTSNPTRKIESKGHGPAYSRDGGKHLNDRETDPPYNANIGPDGPDLNRVGFDTVKAHVKARFMRMEGGTPLIGPLLESGHFTSGTGGQESNWDWAAGVKKGAEGLSKIGESSDKGGQQPSEPGHSGSTGNPTVPVSRSVQRRGRDY